jgi:hypothetical protein
MENTESSPRKAEKRSAFRRFTDGQTGGEYTRENLSVISTNRMIVLSCGVVATSVRFSIMWCVAPVGGATRCARGSNRGKA